MNKILLIIQREYLVRVRNKTFILSTILTPLLFAGLITTVTIISVKNIDHEKIAVIDHTGTMEGNIENTKALSFEFPKGVDSTNYIAKGYSALLYTPGGGNNGYKLISKKQLGMVAESQLEDKINETLENQLLKSKYNVDVKDLEAERKRIGSAKIDQTYQEGSEVKRGNSGLAYGIGYGSGFLIYITLLIYGMMVMRGVTEEKTNRIAEVIISSVKPFQLMIGKIIGIGAVGLTQFLIWIILLVGLTSAATALLPHETLQQAQESTQQMPGGGSMSAASGAANGFADFTNTLSQANWFLIIGCFLFYFLFGYLFYASLFAAVGSTVNEDAQDAQSLQLPITMPIIVSIIIMMNAITNPSGSLATWASLIPFCSPIVMMARIPFGVPGTVPYWQLLLSMTLLVGGFLFTTWVSAKIYRTGILMYGKKATWKEMLKWAFRSN
ncbi:ABC transporter permease [Segetibacter aerophilus]|uniref:ABC transporter permease n=1 Tax=Segetibacter aerophilus TaxID=670293 RepID=A0A512BEG2_9BACT|nr:ABC transporter permease [Segetibacter aerophilus]GEO10344.1 ABC transporter permease [Segetibacter aerophilus]